MMLWWKAWSQVAGSMTAGYIWHSRKLTEVFFSPTTPTHFTQTQRSRLRSFIRYRHNTLLFLNYLILKRTNEQSQPSLYCSVLHHFKLFNTKAPRKVPRNVRFVKRRLSFLNIGSGTGYLQALMEYLSCMEDIGRGEVEESTDQMDELKVSHGIDIYPSLIEYAHNWYVFTN